MIMPRATGTTSMTVTASTSIETSRLMYFYRWIVERHLNNGARHLADKMNMQYVCQCKIFHILTTVSSFASIPQSEETRAELSQITWVLRQVSPDAFHS